MTKVASQSAGASRYGPERLSIIAAVVASALGWLLALGGLIVTISALPELGWDRALWVAALCAAPSAATWMTRRVIASRRVHAVVPPSLLERRYHGMLDAIIDSDRRSLRPIAASAYEVAARTGELLAELMVVPGVRIFRSVRGASADLPRIPHAVTAGRHLVLMESVAWPPGHYETAANGRIHCDGTYIGQSVGSLIAAVQYWRGSLPRSHDVSAMIVVHAAAKCDVTLPPDTPGGLAWVHAEDAIGAIRQRIVSGRQDVSRYLVAALIRATTELT